MRPLPPLNPPLLAIAKFDLSDGLIILAIAEFEFSHGLIILAITEFEF